MGKTKGVRPLDMLPPKTKKKGQQKWAVFSIRIKQESAENLKEIAKEAGYTRNEVIGRFLEYAQTVYEAQKSTRTKGKNNNNSESEEKD